MVSRSLLLALVACCLLGCPKSSPAVDSTPSPTTAASVSPTAEPTTSSATNDPAPDPPQPLDRSCTKDSECVPAPSCCPEPCTSNVINKSAMAEARARVKKQCAEPHEPCPDAGDCAEHAYLCLRSQCAMVMGDSPDFRPRKD